MGDFVRDEVMAAAGGADVTNADADTVVLKVGDDRLKGLGGLLNSREQALPRGLFVHGRDASSRRPKAPEAQGWRFGCRGQERP